MILLAEYPNSDSRILRFCYQILDTLSAEYFAIAYIISICIYTSTFGVVTRFCQQNMDILPAEYCAISCCNISSLYKSALLPAQSYFGRILIVCQQNLSSISYLYALLGVVTHFCQQNIVVSHVIYLHIYKSALLGLQLDSASKIFTFCWQNHILEVS